MAKPIRHRNKWRIRWLDEHGKRRSAVHDTYRQAEYELRRRQTEAEQVKRGLRSPTPPTKTFDELCDYWLRYRAPQKRSQHHDQSIIRRHLRPAFGQLKIREVAGQPIDEFVIERSHLNKKTVANLLTLLISLLRLAHQLGWVEKVPKISKPRIRLCSSDYRWLRTEEEIRRFLVAAREQGEFVYVFYTTAICTGMRAGELAALQWDDVDFERRLITVQRSYDGPTKAEDVRYIPILDALLPILRSWRLRHPGRLVFTNRDGRMYGKSARIFQEVLHRVLDSAGFPTTKLKGKKRRYITFHSLRHTFASHWMMRGGDLFKLQLILGHKSIQMTMRYAHLAPDAFAEDYSRFGGPPTIEADVVPIASALPEASST